MMVASFCADQASLLLKSTVLAEPAMAESPLRNGSALRGCVAVIERGQVAVVLKARHAQQAGAIGALIINSTDSAWRPRGHKGADGCVDEGDDITIPVVVVPKCMGDQLKISQQGDPCLPLLRPPSQAVLGQCMYTYRVLLRVSIDVLAGSVLLFVAWVCT